MSTRRIAIYPGSFDPPTLGHLDLVRRGGTLFDELVVGVLVNPEKRALLSADERVALLEAEIGELGLTGVTARHFEGLTVDFAASVGAGWIVRGVRSGADLSDERSMAGTNRILTGGAVDTVLLPARSDLEFVRARLVRQVARGGGGLEGLVTPRIAAALREAVSNEVR